MITSGALVGTCADLSEITDPALVQALADIDNDCTAYGAVTLSLPLL